MSSDYVTRHEFTKWRNRAAALYVALGLLSGFLLYQSQREPAQRIRDLSAAASSVILYRCQRTNFVTAVLQGAFRQQLALARDRYADGTFSRARYRVSVNTLTRTIRRLAPQDCEAQAAQISKAIR